MNPSYGGPCQGIRNSIPALKKLGIKNEVLCFDKSSIDYGLTDDFVIHKIGASVSPYAYNSKLSEWLLSNLARFDIVLIHGLWLHTSYGTFRTWNMFKKRNSVYPELYVMPHGMLDPYFQKAPDRKFKSFRNSVFWHLFEKKVVNGVDGVLFTCQREKELACKSFKDYHPKNEINVGYGIQQPPPYINEMKNEFLEISGLKENTPYFIFLSRIHEKKGIDLLLDSYTSIVKENKFETIPKLVIAGPLSSKYAQSMKDSVSDRDDIIFTGMLQGNAKWGALYLSEAFVLPSHQENFGIAVVEALACSAPVLISDKINIWKEIVEGEGGIVKSDTKIGVKNLLEQWLQLNNSSKINYRSTAENTYMKYFTIEKAALQFIKQLGIQ
ncbi:glycosyltransferase [uncultured Algoriphagus sp.]|uniref:glycosyltransferase n=1 Tax=uncultured Algoriphagus sp. TaxID=417365 RepID=UPI0030EE6C9E